MFKTGKLGSLKAVPGEVFAIEGSGKKFAIEGQVIFKKTATQWQPMDESLAKAPVQVTNSQSVLSNSVVGFAEQSAGPVRHAPYGCFPTPIIIRTNADSVQFVLTDTIPEVAYLVLARTNRPYGSWHQVAWVIGASNSTSSTITFPLKPSQSEDPAHETFAMPVLANTIFIAGSGEDYDQDGLPDLCEDVFTLTNPAGGTSNDPFIQPDGDGWSNFEKWQRSTSPRPWRPPPGIDLKVPADAAVRQTIRPVTWVTNKDGFELNVSNTVPGLRYLVMSREGSSGYWRASGFFVGSDSRAAVKLVADRHGTLQNSWPCTLPPLLYATNLGEPQFVAGSGEDADGDGLPDIYEVMVTKTDPWRTYTGGTGLPDGYKDSDGDGWPNLEEYRRRTDPLTRNNAPGPIEIVEPTRSEVFEAFGRIAQSELQYEMKVDVRTLIPKGDYRPGVLTKMWAGDVENYDLIQTNVQVRIGVQVPVMTAPREGR
jgi:hypothetical protein